MKYKICPLCKGKMRVFSKESTQDDNKIPCPRCEGEGEI